MKWAPEAAAGAGDLDASEQLFQEMGCTAKLRFCFCFFLLPRVCVSSLFFLKQIYTYIYIYILSWNLFVELFLLQLGHPQEKPTCFCWKKLAPRREPEIAKEGCRKHRCQTHTAG